MARYLLVLLFLFSSVTLVNVYAQDEDSTKAEESWKDSSQTEEWDEDDDWDNDSTDEDIWEDDDDDWMSDWDFEEDFDFEFHGKPTIEANYGIATPDIKSLRGKFSKAGILDFKLGYSTLNSVDDYIIRYRNHYLFLSNLNQEINKAEKVDELSFDTWRFGIGNLDGYGYSFGQSAIIPYTNNSFVWTRMDLQNYPSPYMTNVPSTTLQDTSTLDLFNKSFRFGTSTEAGIKIQIIPLITLNAGYERNLVFPRHLFWKHLGSMVIEWAGIGAVDVFVREVMDSSPAAGPIVNFLLKNAVSFGMYQLRREKMNWPFKTVEPLTMDMWKVGITFTF